MGDRAPRSNWLQRAPLRRAALRPSLRAMRTRTHANTPRGRARQATHDVFVAEGHAARAEEVEVVGAGSRLSCWPPLLSSFARVTRLRLHGHRMTALPHSVGDMAALQVGDSQCVL